MYKPKYSGDKVKVSDHLEDIGREVGEWTGETGQFGEHYGIDIEGEVHFLHYEDLERPGDY